MQTLEQTLEHVADADITTAIELFFTTKKGVAAHLLDVATHDGIVLLTGITDNLLSRFARAGRGNCPGPAQRARRGQ